jgi:hypothetical protein
MSKSKLKFDMSKAWITWSIVGFGIVVYVLFEPQVATPLGFVWGVRYTGRGKRAHFDVWGSFVPVFARRQGVRRRINEEILKINDTVRTSGATPDGQKFMRESGYSYDSKIDIWWKPKTKPVKKARGKS